MDAEKLRLMGFLEDKIECWDENMESIKKQCPDMGVAESEAFLSKLMMQGK